MLRYMSWLDQRYFFSVRVLFLSEPGGRLRTPCGLPRPETTVLGYYAPHAPIQIHHRYKIYGGKREGHLNAPGWPGQSRKSSSL